MNRIKGLHVLFAATALVAGCGGGGGDAPAPAPSPLAQVPDSAGASSAGLVAYIRQLVGLNAEAESAEPVPLSTFNPPQPDDGEPDPVS